MVNVLLLLLQKVVGDGVQGVGAQLVVADQDEEQVQLDAALRVDNLLREGEYSCYILLL